LDFARARLEIVSAGRVAVGAVFGAGFAKPDDCRASTGQPSDFPALLSEGGATHLPIYLI
jgi:hypothetical protein